MYFLKAKFNIKIYCHVITNNTIYWEDYNNTFVIKLRNRNLSQFSVHSRDLGHILVLYGPLISTPKHSSFHCLGNRKVG